jgi:hypothetical protein
MNFRIKQPDTAFQDNVHSKNAKPVRARSYMDWIKTLPCMVTHVYGVDPAHVNTANPKYGHTGRGKADKSSDRWCLPLCRLQHRDQEKRGEETFWKVNNMNQYEACLSLWGAYQERGTDAHDWAVRTILNDGWKVK